MDASYKRYYNITCKLSSIVGIWPYLKPKTRLFRSLFLIAVVLSVFIPQVAYQYMCKMELKCTVQNFSSSILPVLVVIMLYTFQANARTIKILTERLYIDWKELNSLEEYEIMKSYAESNRQFSLLYAVYIFFTIFIFQSMSLVPFILDIVLPLNESRAIILPYPSYYFVDVERYFLQIFSHSFVAWEFTMVALVAHDCMFFTYVEHVCSSFAVIGYRFEHLLSNEAVGLVNAYSADEYCKRIASFVNMHEKALKMAQLIEDIFSIPYLIQLFLATTGISINLFQISQQDNSIMETIKYMAFVVAQLIHVFFLSFEGQKLIDHSLQMRNRIYNSSWYNVSVKSRKLIMMIMMKSLRPCFLSAGKLFIFSLESFITLVQASMSYFAMLSSVQ